MREPKCISPILCPVLMLSPTSIQDEILRATMDAGKFQGVMVAIQYSTFAQKELERHFGSVRRRVSLVNVPPAFLFACGAALPQEAGERR